LVFNLGILLYLYLRRKRYRLRARHEDGRPGGDSAWKPSRADTACPEKSLE